VLPVKAIIDGCFKRNVRKKMAENMPGRGWGAITWSLCCYQKDFDEKET
jgi:hypothetical protein